MKKQIRQVTGTQVGITFTKEERRIYNLEVGKIVDLSDIVAVDLEVLKQMTVGQIKKLSEECNDN